MVSTVWRWLILALVLTGARCAAPEAKPIEGDIASVLEQGIAEGNESFDHTVWQEILTRHLKNDGREFDYAGLKEEEAVFEGYLGALAKVDLPTLSGQELEALFINAYNAYTVKTILDEVEPDGTYRIESIREISDVFDRPVHKVGGFTLSLNNMEHNDPRVHFAVNCASISCPPLPPSAFTGQGLEEQLEKATRSALQLPDYADVVEDKLLLTKIMDWYGEDFVNPEFEGSEKSLALFVKRYATDHVKAWIGKREAGEVPISFRTYNWGLNRTE